MTATLEKKIEIRYLGTSPILKPSRERFSSLIEHHFEERNNLVGYRMETSHEGFVVHLHFNGEKGFVFLEDMPAAELNSSELQRQYSEKGALIIGKYALNTKNKAGFMWEARE